MKKLATAALALGLLAGSCTTAMAMEPEINYNGQVLHLNQPVIIQEGRTLLAMRDMAEQMHVDVSWDSSTRLATVTYKDQVVTLQPDLRRVLVNNVEHSLDVGPQIIDNRIYLPARYLFELLDCDVFFRQYEDGKQVIAVHTRDAYMNYVVQEGRTTKAVRTAQENGTNQVMMLQDGNILETVNQDGHILLYRTTSTLSRQAQHKTSPWLYDGITHILVQDGHLYGVLDAPQSADYVGTGYFPAGTALLREIVTPQGTYRFYESAASLQTLALDSKLGYATTNVKGYMLGIAGSKQPIRDTAYAFTGHGGYGFLTDGQLLMIQNTAGEGFQVAGCHTISDTMKDGKVFTANGQYYVIGVDTAASGSQELFACSFMDYGMKANSYVPVTSLASSASYRYLQILDSVQIDNKAYLLLKTDRMRYLACYNLTTRTMTTEALTAPYEKFVPAKGSWQLYYGDADYNYFMTVTP